MGSSLSKSHHHRNYWHEEPGQVIASDAAQRIDGSQPGPLLNGDDHQMRFLND